VVKAWTAPDTFAFNGRYNQRYVNIWPLPIQRPHPPIWIPGGGWRCHANGSRKGCSQG
jgi:alkanesulfonate monooxygenase SsuD/methylene tetrahydromethanopterin reductase-like flavin-dependent oxidoreductase (luciferase family)